jgi:hypothetical protein
MADYSAYAPALKRRCQKYLDANPGATATPWTVALLCLPKKQQRAANLRALVRGMPEEFALANIRVQRGSGRIVVDKHIVCFSCTTGAGHGSTAGGADQQQEQEPHAADLHWCALCKVQCTSAQGWQGHINGQGHKARLLQRTAQGQQYGGLYEDKHGVTVSQLPEEAVGLQAGLSYTLELTVTNTNGWAVAMQGCGQLPLLQEVQVLGGEPAQLAPVGAFSRLLFASFALLAPAARFAAPSHAAFLPGHSAGLLFQLFTPGPCPATGCLRAPRSRCRCASSPGAWATCGPCWCSTLVGQPGWALHTLNLRCINDMRPALKQPAAAAKRAP